VSAIAVPEAPRKAATGLRPTLNTPDPDIDGNAQPKRHNGTESANENPPWEIEEKTRAVLADALNETHALLTRYVEFPQREQSEALTLWIAYTHWFGAGQPFGFAPYLLLTSAERQSGKTTLMELARMLVHNPLDGQDMSAALVGRLCGGRTLLLDEIDGVYTGRASGDADGATDLRTVLNAGFRHDGKYQRLNRNTMKPEEFSTYGPKMLAGIGRNVPDTVVDRSIAIRMERKAHAKSLPKLRARLVEGDATALRDRLRELAQTVALAWVDVDEFPEALDGRRQDIWEPLYALARAAGAEWLDRAIKASVTLSRSEPNLTLGQRLLRDVRSIFEAEGWPEYLSTVALIGETGDPHEYTKASGLCAVEDEAWATFSRRKPITPHKLSQMLGDYGIRSERESQGSHGYGPKGYWRTAFDRAV